MDKDSFIFPFPGQITNGFSRTETPPGSGRLGAKPIPNKPWATRLKRLVDLGLGLGLLLAASPLMLLIATAIWVGDRGPIFFAQRRVGRHGRVFSCYKYRTMGVDQHRRLEALLDRNPAAAEDWLRQHKVHNDPRVTRVGRVLRRWSLDELPQLANVVLGDMSLVGPRPIVASEMARYGEGFAAYATVSPGLTGLWQVRRTRHTSFEQRVAMDVAYARSWTVTNDLILLALTVPAVIAGRYER